MQNYNIILLTEDISEGSAVVEPVSLQEMKSYLRLDGFLDDDDSTDVPPYEDDDALIEELITSARQELEEYLNCSIISHDWRCSGVTNTAGSIQLPYGPVTELTLIEDSEGDEFDLEDTGEVKRRGDYLVYPTQEDMTVEYTAGFVIVPRAITAEIKRMVAWKYEHRGDEDVAPYQYSDGVLKYSRSSWLG